MDEKRIKRYRDKISVVVKRRDNISEWMDEKDEKSILAIYKAYQELIEAFTDIFAMMLKDMDSVVEDDYSNIEKLRVEGLLNEEQSALMKQANGLRNRLVHEYNGIERETALRSMTHIDQQLEGILEEIEGWINVD